MPNQEINPAQYDLLLVGHMAKDRNVVDGHGKLESGGGVYFGGIAAARLGLHVAVVSRLAAVDFSRLDELKREGIRVFAQPAAQTSGIENTYSSADMETRICKPLGFAGPIQAADLPDVTARVYAITPIIAGEVDMQVLRTLAARGPVALDVQGFVRVPIGDALVFQPWKQMAEGLGHVTYLKVDRAEAQLLTGKSETADAVRALGDYGPREIVLTESSGVTVYAEGRVYQAPFTPRSLSGRTGRGDTCFATYLGKRLALDPEQACKWAAAVTTLKQEQPGPWRGNPEEIRRLVT